MTDAAQRIQWRLKAMVEEVEAELEPLTIPPNFVPASIDDGQLTGEERRKVQYLNGYLDALKAMLVLTKEEIHD